MLHPRLSDFAGCGGWGEPDTQKHDVYPSWHLQQKSETIFVSSLKLFETFRNYLMLAWRRFRIYTYCIHVVFSMFMDKMLNLQHSNANAHGFFFGTCFFQPTSTVPIFTCFSELGAPGTVRLPPRLLRLLLRPPSTASGGGCRWKPSSSP